METGKDLSHGGGAKYNVGPVLTGIGLGVVSNGLAAIKKVVFEDKDTTLEELDKALDADWVGYEDLRELVFAVPKYGNDNDYVDSLAIEISDFFSIDRLVNIRIFLGLVSILHLWEFQIIFLQGKLLVPYLAVERQRPPL